MSCTELSGSSLAPRKGNLVDTGKNGAGEEVCWKDGAEKEAEGMLGENRC